MAGGAVVPLGNGEVPVHRVGVLGQVVGLDDKEVTAVGRKLLRRQAGRRHPEHDAEGSVLVEFLPPFPQVLAAALHQLHGLVPVLQIRHHGEHDPQRAMGRCTEQGTDLGLELVRTAQAGADAPQAQLGGLQTLMDVGHGAVHTKIKGAHREHPALGGGQAGLIEDVLLLLVHRTARQHQVAAAQQAHASRAGLQGRLDILLPVAVGKQFKFGTVLRPAGQGADAGQFLVFPLHLADAGHGLLAGDGVRVQDAFAIVGVQHHSAAVAVIQKIPAQLHHTGDVHGPRNDGGMALAAALRGDDTQNHPRRDAEQVAGHQHIGSQHHGMVQRQPDPGAVRQDIHHPAGGVQDIHTAQLHVSVVFHVGQLVGIAVAHPVHGLGGTDTCLDLEAHLVHKAFVFQHHALEQENGLFRGAAALGHGIQFLLGRFYGLFQQPLFPVRVERPGAKAFLPPFQAAHLAHDKARGSGMSLIDFHPSITSGSTGPVRARYTSACKKVLGSRAAQAACAALPLPSNSGAKLSIRARSHFSRNALPSVSVV